jgi:hypothetical protein
MFDQKKQELIQHCNRLIKAQPEISETIVDLIAVIRRSKYDDPDSLNLINKKYLVVKGILPKTENVSIFYKLINAFLNIFGVSTPKLYQNKICLLLNEIINNECNHVSIVNNAFTGTNTVSNPLNSKDAYSIYKARLTSMKDSLDKPDPQLPEITK